MLTIHKYRNLDNDWDREEILECCKSDTTKDGSCGDCCYDTWSDELKQVSKNYKAKKAQADQLQKRYDFLSDRRRTFKGWLDEIDAAQDLAKKICAQLELIASHSEKIWSNAHLAIRAIEILFCMLRDFFQQLDYLKKRYDELQLCISKITDPSLEKGQGGILKCLDDYYGKLNVLLGLRDDILKAAVEAVRLSNILRNEISTREFPWEYIPCETKYDPCSHHHKPCPDYNEDHVYYGYKTIVCEWYKFFRCEEPCETNGDQQGQKRNQKPNEGPMNTNKDDCCEENPLETFSFPICNDSYRS
jgi:hypothetical protein